MNAVSIKNRTDRKTTRKMWIFFILFIAVAALIIGRLIKYQITDADINRAYVTSINTAQAEVSPKRGNIYDRNGNLLATSVTVYNVIVSPDDIRERKESDEKKNSDSNENNDVFYDLTADKYGKEVHVKNVDKMISSILSEYLGVSESEIREKLEKENRKYESIKKEIDEETKLKIDKVIEDFSLETLIFYETQYKRYYPMDDFACHVIGFVGTDGTGRYGLEAYYNDVLEGTAGKYIKTRRNMPFGYEREIAVQNGLDIVTTLDVYVQHELEDQLKKTFIESQAGNRVTGIVMDVKTGEILAMATYPSFDLNNPSVLDEYSQAELDGMNLDKDSEEYSEAYSNLLFRMWNNKAVNETYEPGSTFKVITTSMAFENNLVSEYDYFTCYGSMYVEGWPAPISCAKEDGHGTVYFKYGLQQSCNPTLMQVAAIVGKDTFYSYMDAYGYFEKVGIDLPGEASGIFHSYSDFSTASLAVYSFGQTFKTTPIQQLRALSSVANGGVLMVPHLMKQVLDENGNVVEEYGHAEVRQVVSAETCRRITDILEEGVATDGAAVNAYVKGYRVAAKTGTSEKLDKYDEFGERPYRVGSTIAYAPADDPQFSALIVVDEPMGGVVYGGSVAAPYISALLSDILPYLGVEPRYTTDELASLDVVVSNYVGATVENSITDLSWRKFKYEIIGNGDVVTAQVPSEGTRISSDTGILLLYTEDESVQTTQVPDLMGMSAYNANLIATSNGLNVTFSGSTNGTEATVIGQSLTPGDVVPRGTVIDIELRYLGGLD